jgi:hypothetical protein
MMMMITTMIAGRVMKRGGVGGSSAVQRRSGYLATGNPRGGLALQFPLLIFPIKVLFVWHFKLTGWKE